MKKSTFIIILLQLSLFTASSFAQYYNYSGPPITYGYHNNNKFRAQISTYGTIEPIRYPGYGIYDGDFYSQRTSLWVGGIVNGDTLVSCARAPHDYYQIEFWPDYPPAGYIKDVSPDKDIYPEPITRPEQVYFTEYTDTFKTAHFVPYDNYDHRYHKPLNIRVAQYSYTYKYGYAEDFMIVDYKIQNIGSEPIENCFVGFFHEGQIAKSGQFIPGVDIGDNEGYLDSVPSEVPGLGYEQIDAAWTCDQNGYPEKGKFGTLSMTSILGIAPIAFPASATVRTFNWWVVTQGVWWAEILDSWGPRRRGTYDDPMRLFNNQRGVPFTDPDRYYMMAHAEIDYPGYFAAADMSRQGWLNAPEDVGGYVANGHSSNSVMALGPFDIGPGEFESVVIVYAIGQNFHTQGDAYNRLFNPAAPGVFMRTLNQKDLINNIRWAKRIYDNPGVDTDGDGDSGKYVYQYDPEYGDSLKRYYAGDGVPDLAGAQPPPPPEFRVYTENNKIILRWNGRGIETHYDRFSSVRDFEGYRVYMSRSELDSELSLLASYDQENYNQYQWNRTLEQYELLEIPFSLDSLINMYGDDFNPNDYSEPFNPFYFNNKHFYFEPVGYNLSDLHDQDGIHKVYPDATKDTNDVDEEGRMRYYEYEYIIDNVLSTIPYYVSVTSFDFGLPSKSLDPGESDPMESLRLAYGVGNDWEDDGTNNAKELNVYVFPNPYIADGSYREDAFENRFTDLIADRTRAVYFANLPSKCRIKIYSLDGDLIDEIIHEKEDGAGDANIASWDIITKNNMTITSGIYYWVVESEFGNQVGKWVMIR